MLGQPAAVKRLMGYVVTFSEVVNEFDHPAVPIVKAGIALFGRGLPARTRTWNHRLGGGSYILFNYRETAPVYLKVPLALIGDASDRRVNGPGL